MKIKPKFIVREITSENGERTSGGAPYTDKLAAIIAAALWKSATEKDCRVYDASMNCVYDTSISGAELELSQCLSTSQLSAPLQSRWPADGLSQAS